MVEVDALDNEEMAVDVVNVVSGELLVIGESDVYVVLVSSVVVVISVTFVVTVVVGWHVSSVHVLVTMIVCVVETEGIVFDVLSKVEECDSIGTSCFEVVVVIEVGGTIGAKLDGGGTADVESNVGDVVVSHKNDGETMFGMVTVVVMMPLVIVVVDGTSPNEPDIVTLAVHEVDVNVITALPTVKTDS